VTQGLIDSIGKIVDLKSQGTLHSCNGVDIDQREYVKVSCQSYLGRMLKAHGWDKPSPTEKSDSKPIDPLAASTAEELSTSVGPAEGSTESFEDGYHRHARLFSSSNSIVNAKSSPQGWA
jgi:hypothetical protein